jgi:WD40 repeat protein
LNFIGRQLALVLVAAFCAETLSDEVAPAPITCLVISGDGQTVISGSQQGITLRDWEQLAVQRRLPISFHQLHDLCLSPDESMLAVAGGNPAEHATVAMFSWPQLQLMWTKSFSDDVVYSIAFDATGTQLAAGGHDHSVSLMSTATGDILRVLNGHSKPVTGVAYLPDGELLLSCSIDQTIRVWNTANGTLARSLTNHTRAVNQVVPGKRGNGTQALAVSIGDDRTVRFWQPTIGRMVRFKRLDAPVTTVAWSVDGGRVFAGTQDQRLISVEVQTLETTVLDVPPDGWIHCLAVHSSGSKLVIGTSNGTVRKVMTGE